MGKCYNLYDYPPPPPPPVGVKLSILPYFLKAFVHCSPALDGYTNSAFRNTILVHVTITKDAFFNWEIKS